MAEMEDKFISEDWRREYEKIILSKKYSRACTAVAFALANPNIDNVKIAFGSVSDYINSLPLPIDKHKERDEFIKKLDEINLIIYGCRKDENGKKIKEIEELEKKYKVFTIKAREGVKMIDTLQNLPNLIIELRGILIEAGEFATSSGLRVSLARPREFGKDRLLKEENFEDLDLGLDV